MPRVPIIPGSSGRLTFALASSVLSLLLFSLVMGVSPNVDTRLVELGEAIWPGYARDIRPGAPSPPACNAEQLEVQATTCASRQKAGPRPANQGKAPTQTNTPPVAGDPFADEDPFADSEAEQPGENCAALRALADRCHNRHADYEKILKRMTWANQAYRHLELLVSGLAWFPYWQHVLALVVVLGALTTTIGRKHIALRVPGSRLEHGVKQGAELLANVLLMFSTAADAVIQTGSQAEATTPFLSVIWSIGFAAMTATNVYHLVRSPPARHDPVVLRRLLMVIPLYAYLAIVSGLYFLIVEHHWSGQAIYLHKFAQVPSVYLGVALYIWAGVLFSLTRIARLVFGVLRPWHLPPALMAWLVVVLAALPTAYSGASGIFVMAAGAVIFEQLREAGTSPRLALATTAMSGSLGVVLRPCLVVVLIATLNKQVTTAELYDKGVWVFLLTAALFLVAMLLKKESRLERPAIGTSMRHSLRAVKPLLPYALIAFGVWLVYAGPLGTHFDEHTAALVLPAIMLGMVLYERAVARREVRDETIASEGEPAAQEGLWRTLVATTEGSASHVGALLTLMATSVCLGGVVERADLMGHIPETLGTPVTTMMVLVVVMVIVGMTMDPLGAVVLVSVSLATVAYRSGIDPVHFWMMVLVAFELGYLTPPVALNHLLARQVIGEPARVENVPASGVWSRYEHIFIPMIVMGSALLIVAFVPLAFY